jgi:hypothetical protein
LDIPHRDVNSSMGLPPSRPTRETARLQSRENLWGSCRYTTFLRTHYSRRWKIKFGKNERPVSRRTRGEVLGGYSASQIGCPLDFVTIRDFFAPSHRRSTSPKRGAIMRRFIPRATFSSSQSKCAIGDTHTLGPSGLATVCRITQGAGSLPCALRITASRNVRPHVT